MKSLSFLMLLLMATMGSTSPVLGNSTTEIVEAVSIDLEDNEESYCVYY